MPDEAPQKTPLRFTLTGAGIAAIIASIIPVIVLFRGEPTAEKVASRSDQENKRLYQNQQKLYRRMALAESKLEFFERVCVRYGASVVEGEQKPTQKVKSPPALPRITRPTRPPIKCRSGYVLRDTKCVKTKTALIDAIKALKSVKKSRDSAVKNALVAKKRAEHKARTAQQAAQILAPPAPLLKKD